MNTPARILTRLALVLALTALAAPTHAQLTPQQYAQDIEHLLEKRLPSNRALAEPARAQARDLLRSAADSAEELDDITFALLVMRVTALSGNGHNLAGFGLLSRFARLPIRVWWFADGLHVVKASEEHADLLGATVEEIGALSPAEALQAAAPHLSGNESWRSHRSIEFLTRVPLLAGIGASISPDEIEMTFTTATGARVSRVLSAVEQPDPEDDTLQPWKESMLRLASKETNAPRWPHVLDSVDARPAHLRSSDTVYFEALEDISACYVRVAGIRNPHGPGSLQEELFNTLSHLERERPKNLIVDLRFNTGGNFFNILPFAFGVGVLIPPEGRIFLLANRCTFSAAIVTMALIKQQAGAERVTVVGEPIGDDLRFWSEGGHVTLPNSGILVTYNDGLHDMVDGCQPDEPCWWGAAAFERGVGDLDPDLPILERFEDYSSGRDLYLEAVRMELGAPAVPMGR